VPAAGVIIEVNADPLDCQGFTRSERGVGFTQIKHTTQETDTAEDAFPREKEKGSRGKRGVWTSSQNVSPIQAARGPWGPSVRQIRTGSHRFTGLTP